MNIKSMIQEAAYSCFRLFPIKQQKVLLFSYYGEQYSGSPKYIGQYLSQKTDCDVVWAFVSPERHADVSGRKIKYGHLTYFYNLATAGTIITNYRMTEQFKKRSGQKYIQTWHSSLRLKMIEKDAEETLPKHYLEMAKKDSKQIDYLLAGSAKSKEIFEHSFWYNGRIIPSGTPQCDILLGKTKELKKRVCHFFKIPEEANIALFAPTFRKGHNTSVYNLNTKQVLAGLSARFGGEWYILMRLHPHLVNKIDCFQYDAHTLEATKYDDVQELLAASDILISDYSAIMFDYSVTRKPCFLYTPDFEEYTTKDRKLYFDIRELPFEIAYTNNELMQKIGTFSSEDYANRMEKFMLTIGSYDDGHACERVAALIKEKS